MQKPRPVSGAKAYIPLVKMLALALGPDAVVLLYRFTKGEPEIECACRDSGTCEAEALETHFLSDDLTEDNLANVAVVDESGHTFRASAAIIRDAEGNREAAVAVRFDTARMCEVVSYLLQFLRFEPSDERFVSPQSVEELVESIIDDVLKDGHLDGTRRSDKMELVSKLERKGIFLTRGAVEKVSERMGIAQVTVYSYLDEIKKRRKAKEGGR